MKEPSEEHEQTEKALQESEVRSKSLESRLRFLTSRLLTAQETERRRISRELHDGLGGALAVLKLRVNFIKRHLPEDQVELRKECEDVLHYVDEIIESSHRISRDLNPSILEDLGLSAALRWLVDTFVKHYGIRAIFDMEDIDHLFSRESQIMIYRVFQEALTNIGKHAQAQNVSIGVKKGADTISFSVRDDGKGFDIMKVLQGAAMERGLGLATMEERASMLGGTFDVRSEKMRGSEIILTLPLKGV